MADPLTQLQASLDELVGQFFTSLSFINQHHDFKVPEGSPDFVSKAEDPQLQALPKEEFEQKLRQFAKDIVAKSREIDIQSDNINSLSSAKDDIATLEGQLEQANIEEQQVLKQRDELLVECDEIVKKLTEMKSSLRDS